MDQKRLHELEAQCIQECAPECTATCPVHVDVRGMAAVMRTGDIVTAFKLFKKSVIFPGIVSRLCDQPCRTPCKRSESGDAIQIKYLERACVQYSTEPAEKIKPSSRKAKKVACVGGSLSSLAAAFDLAKKGYEVVMFEQADRLGGRLWSIPDLQLPKPLLLSDLSVIEEAGIEIRLNVSIGRDFSFAELRSQFDALYLGCGLDTALRLGLGEGEQVQVDPLTYAIVMDGIFAGGGIIADRPNGSPIYSISDGRRAAISIDRYLQKVSLTASRINEGSYQTRLFTNTKGIPALPEVCIVDPSSGYTADEAAQEAARCLQCDCMECVKACEYLAHYGSYPRKYVREIYNNLTIIMRSRSANRFINSCSLCGLCAEVCPEGLNMGTVCREARQTMVQSNKMPVAAHDFALRDMAFSNGEYAALSLKPSNLARSEYLFFPGCQLGASNPEYVGRVYDDLSRRLSPALGIMLRCCSAPADWAGQVALSQDALEEIKSEYQRFGNPVVILACSTCYQIFKDNLPEIPILSLWEVYDRIGLPERTTNNISNALTIHDPCTTRHAPHIQQSVRRILDKLNCNYNELELSGERTECCGYGGLMWCANPGLADNVARRRVMQSSSDYITYCVMCRDQFAAQGKPALHLLDLIYGGDLKALAIRESPGYSTRHDNRARLKRYFLNLLAGEDMGTLHDYENLNLNISPEVLKSIEERRILVEEIQQVIDHAEKTGEKFLNTNNGHFLATYRPAHVTYWVEYGIDDEKYIVYRAYCHRMEVSGDIKK